MDRERERGGGERREEALLSGRASGRGAESSRLCGVVGLEHEQVLHYTTNNVFCVRYTRYILDIVRFHQHNTITDGFETARNSTFYIWRMIINAVHGVSLKYFFFICDRYLGRWNYPFVIYYLLIRKNEKVSTFKISLFAMYFTLSRSLIRISFWYWKYFLRFRINFLRV